MIVYELIRGALSSASTDQPPEELGYSKGTRPGGYCYTVRYVYTVIYFYLYRVLESTQQVLFSFYSF